MQHLRSSEFPMTGQLGIVKLDMEDLYHLKVGDVIDLNKTKNSAVKLYVGRQPWFTGKMGIFKKNIAVRIEDRIMQKQESPKEVVDNAFTPEEDPIEEEKKSPNSDIAAEDIQDLLEDAEEDYSLSE